MKDDKHRSADYRRCLLCTRGRGSFRKNRGEVHAEMYRLEKAQVEEEEYSASVKRE